MKWLEAILNSNNLADDVKANILEEAKKQKLIPKERFDSVNSQLKEANNSLTKVNEELETIKGQVKNNEILEQKITDLQNNHSNQIKEYESKIKGMKVQDYVKGEMLKDLRDSKYFDLLYKEVDQSKINVAEDGTVTGFDIAPIKEKYSDLFNEPGNPMGSLGNPGKGTMTPGKESLGKRLATQRTEQFSQPKENPYF